MCKYVYAFEANPLLYGKLIDGFKNNKNIKVENVAVSSESGETDLRIPIRDITASFDNEEKYKLGTATIHETNNLENEKFETIKAIKKISLDEYNFEHEIGFIKIDVEGHELEILNGARKTLARCSPIIVIERCVLNSTAYGYSKNDSHKLLVELGYSRAIKITRDCIYTKK